MMFSYKVEKNNTALLVRNIASDFMNYIRKYKLKQEDMMDFAVADDFSAEYMKNEPNELLRYHMSTLEEIKEDLIDIAFAQGFIIGLTNKMKLDSKLRESLMYVFNKLTELRDKVALNLPQDDDGK